MSKKLTGNKTQKIPIGEIEGSYLLVNFDWGLEIRKSTEDFHGTKEIDESEATYTIRRVELYLSEFRKCTLESYQLTDKQQQAIEQVLSIYE